MRLLSVHSSRLRSRRRGRGRCHRHRHRRCNCNQPAASRSGTGGPGAAGIIGSSGGAQIAASSGIPKNEVYPEFDLVMAIWYNM